MDARLAELLRLSELRRRREPETQIKGAVLAIQRQARTALRHGGGAAEAWTACVPAALAVRSRLDSIRAGTLQVAVDGASALWELDSLLRSGLAERLRAASGGAVQRVRLRVAGAVIPDRRDEAVEE